MKLAPSPEAFEEHKTKFEARRKTQVKSYVETLGKQVERILQIIATYQKLSNPKVKRDNRKKVAA
jgi:hypothetical protein